MISENPKEVLEVMKYEIPVINGKEFSNNMITFDSKNIFLVHVNSITEWLHKNLNPLYNIEAAGGMILNEKKELLMIFRNGKWDLPKGKTDPGEQPLDAALRECREECGISYLHAGSLLEVTWHAYPYREGWALKKTHWFFLSSNSDEKLIPQIQEGITEIGWFNTRSIEYRFSEMYRMIEYLIKKHYKLLISGNE